MMNEPLTPVCRSSALRHPRLLLLAAIIITLSCLTAPAFAEAWPRGAGRSYVYLGVSTADSDQFRMPDGSTVPFPGRDNREQRASLYGEVGLTDELTLVVNVPYKRVQTRGLVSTFETSGLADADLRLRWSIGIRKTWLGVEGGIIVPLGYDTKDFPALGSGEADGVLNLALGTSIDWLPEGFLSLDAGYRFRGGAIDDEIPYAAKLGAFPFSRVGLFAFIRGWSSRADFSKVDPSLGLFIADSEKAAAGLEIYVRLSARLDANVTWSKTLRGRNITDGDELSVGLAVHVE